MMSEKNKKSITTKPPTILDPTTCVKKGLCTVAKDRSVHTHQLYYEVHGSLEGSQRMLFIMGLNNSCSGWSFQVKHFSRKPDHAVLIFDNRGVGNSESGPREIYKTSEMAKDAVDLMDFLGWREDRSVHVFGVSMGGMITQELCLLVPKRVKSVGFISTKAGDRFDLPPLKGIYMFARLMSQTFTIHQGLELVITTLFPPAHLNERTADGRTRKQELYDFFLERFRTTPKQAPAGALGQVTAVLLHSCSRNALQRISEELKPAKILIMSGDEDYIISPTRSIELHELVPESELVIFKGAGHAISIQMPNEFNALLERTMEEGNRRFMKCC